MVKTRKAVLKIRRAGSGKRRGAASGVATPRRIERARRPVKCPNCNYSPVASILYGLPAFSEKLDKALTAGRVTLGGCCVSDDDPAWQCDKCGVVIYRRRP